MIIHKNLEVYAFQDEQEFSDWMKLHFENTNGFWLRYYKKNSKVKTITHEQAVDIALCWGWIDGLINKYDDQSYLVRFTPRRLKSVWSKINVSKVERLIQEERMQASGMYHVNLAKEDGRWERAYEPSSKMQVPDEFLKMIQKNKQALSFYTSLDKANLYAIAFRIQQQPTQEKRNAKMKELYAMLKEKKEISFINELTFKMAFIRHLWCIHYLFLNSPINSQFAKNYQRSGTRFITIDHELIFQLIAHPDYQRLRRIKQMALAYLVYPGAVHTRLHHSLGAYHLMSQAIVELRQKKIDITQEEELAAKIAILLHDIGHGPFSHALEHSLVDITHEQLSLIIMHKLNHFFEGQLSMAISIFKNEYPKQFLHQLVSGQLDVDRLDYLARDSFFTGVSEGVIGYDRIIKMLTVVNDQLMVEEKGIHSIEKFLIARRLMYSQVYLHKTVLSSELMLVNILRRAKELVQEEKPLFASPSFCIF